jgi:hypothetical protein
MQLMRCNHCPFGSLGRFLQLLQRRLSVHSVQGQSFRWEVCGMSQPVRSSALNFSSPWLVETPESFVIFDASDAWVFLSPAAPIFIWGICTHRWFLLHSYKMCYMPCSWRNNNSPGTRLYSRSMRTRSAAKRSQHGGYFRNGSSSVSAGRCRSCTWRRVVSLVGPG